MSQPIVLVTFYSRCGSTEKVALAAAVGAVQARALIRLRRVPDSAVGPFVESPECNENLARMHKEYVVPSEADFLGADAIIFATPNDTSAISAEWSDCLQLLAKLQSQGKLKGKAGAVLRGANESTPGSFAGTMMGLGLNMITINSTPETPESAMTLGRDVANLARTLKSTRGAG